MELSKRVTSLELSKKLKELGVEQVLQRGDWFWSAGKGVSYKLKLCLNKLHAKQYYKAFTVAELGEMLPEHISSQKEDWGWAIYVKGFLKEEYNSDTEANARAKLLINLIKSK